MKSTSILQVGAEVVTEVDEEVVELDVEDTPGPAVEVFVEVEVDVEVFVVVLGRRVVVDEVDEDDEVDVPDVVDEPEVVDTVEVDIFTTTPTPGFG